MNFQDKVFESAGILNDRARAFVAATTAKVRTHATEASRQLELKSRLSTLKVAGGELRNIARQHGGRFVQQNASIAKAAGSDLTRLGRSLYLQLSGQEKSAVRPARKAAARRKRASGKAD